LLHCKSPKASKSRRLPERRLGEHVGPCRGKSTKESRVEIVPSRRSYVKRPATFGASLPTLIREN